MRSQGSVPKTERDKTETAAKTRFLGKECSRTVKLESDTDVLESKTIGKNSPVCDWTIDTRQARVMRCFGSRQQ